MVIERKTTALVIGAAGQDGQYLSLLLEEKGFEVIRVTRKESSAFSLSMDLSDPEICNSFMDNQRPEIVFHLAAKHGSSESMKFDGEWRDEMYSTHVQITENLVNSISKTGGRTHLVVAGSSRIFGIATDSDLVVNESTEVNPQDYYAETKVAAWDLVKRARFEHGINANFLILFNHDSPLRQKTFVSSLIARQVASIVRGAPAEIIVRDKYARADWSHAKDIVNGIFLAGTSGVCQDFILSSGVAKSVEELILEQVKRYGLNDVEIHSSSSPGARPCFIGDFQRAHDVLRWTPASSITNALFEMVQMELDCSTDNS